MDLPSQTARRPKHGRPQPKSHRNPAAYARFKIGSIIRMVIDAKQKQYFYPHPATRTQAENIQNLRLSLSLSIYIYIYIYMHAYMRVCVYIYMQKRNKPVPRPPRRWSQIKRLSPQKGYRHPKGAPFCPHPRSEAADYRATSTQSK